MEFRKEPGRIFATDETGKLLAGQGIAGQLLRAVADTLRRDGRKARATCSYAVHWFETHPEEKDLLG